MLSARSTAPVGVRKQNTHPQSKKKTCTRMGVRAFTLTEVVKKNMNYKNYVKAICQSMSST
jgi:hypothetical protein